MKTLLLAFCLFFSLNQVFAQQFEVPSDYKLETAEDFAFYERQVIACVDFLNNTSPKEQQEKRQEASAFLLQWLMGAPNVTVELNEHFITFAESSPELLSIYLGGWTRHALLTGEKTNFAGNLAGLEAVINYYNRYRALLNKDRNVEKFIKMQEKGKLADYIRKYT
ncbi:MAG: hypothetical protein GYB31_02820 [Bacteroidetes bacterium]|nr:hypothetical protein [Bacteroidota bacterium]